MALSSASQSSPSPISSAVGRIAGGSSPIHASRSCGSYTVGPTQRMPRGRNWLFSPFLVRAPTAGRRQLPHEIPGMSELRGGGGDGDRAGRAPPGQRLARRVELDMDPNAIFRDAIWSGIVRKSEQRRSEYLKTLRGLGSQPQDLEQRVAATANHFASLARELSSGAEAWLVTKSSEPVEGKAEIQAKLHSELRAAKVWYLKRASARLQKNDAKQVNRATKQALSEIESIAVDLFQRAESPFVDDGGTTRRPASYNPRLKILFLSADAARAEDGGRPGSALNLDVELREIQEAIRSGSLRDHIDLKIATAVTKEALISELNHHKPAVVHFSGHGGSVGIALVGKLGSLDQVHPTFLRQIFLSTPSVQFVVLNACHSAKQAEAISHVVGPTIGTVAEIDDDLAIRFSRSLYSGISNGLPLDDILRQLDTLLEGETQRNRPILYNGRAADLRTLVLAKDPKYADYAILIGSLRRAVVKFRARDEKLIKILNDAAALSMAARKYNLKPPTLPAETQTPRRARCVRSGARANASGCFLG